MTPSEKRAAYLIYKELQELEREEDVEARLDELPRETREAVERFRSNEKRVQRLEAEEKGPEVQRTVLQDNNIEAVVESFKQRLASDPRAGIEDFLDSPRVDVDHRVYLFRRLLATERAHRKRWNQEHPPEQQLAVDYESYWSRRFFEESYEEGKYQSETAGVMLAEIPEQGYRFVREIGTGGMGRVLLVELYDDEIQDRDRDYFSPLEGREKGSTRRVEALKIVLLKGLAKDWTTQRRDDFLKRFEMERKALKSVTHDNLASFYTHGKIDGLAYFTMRYVEGLTLFKHVQQGRPWSEEEVATRMAPLADLVHQMHSKAGIIHRDLKPDNFILDETINRVFLIDFGLARPLTAKPSTQPLTQLGDRMGTEKFSPPEQWGGKPTDERSDVYTFGATLYYLLTGQDDPEKRQKALRSGSEARGAMSRAMAEVCRKALQERPEDRYQSMDALAADLAPIGRQAPSPAPPVATHSPLPAPADADRKLRVPAIVHPLAEVLPAIALFTMLNMAAATGVFPFTKGLLFLDTIGTCAVALAFGPWYGAACGALTNVLWALLALVFKHEAHYEDFGIVNAALGLYWGALSCRWPGLSALGQSPSFARGLSYACAYGVVGAGLAAAIVVPIHICHLELSITEPIENIHRLYLAMLQLLGREHPDPLSLFAGYMIYSVPDKIVSALLAWLIIEFFMPLYKKNAALFTSTRAVVVEHAGPWCAASTAAFAALCLLLVWGERWLPLCWVLLVAGPLVCLAYYNRTLSPDQKGRLRDYSANWKELRRELHDLRKAGHVYTAIKWGVLSGVLILFYYLVWYFIAGRLQVPGEKELSDSILRVGLVFLVILLLALLVLFIVADNIAYLQVESAPRGPDKEKSSE
jgi:serine/threonine protein kinase